MLTWLVVLACAALVGVEALNKLHRTDLSRRALKPLPWPRRWSEVLRATGWFSLVLAAGGAMWWETMPPEYLRIGYGLALVGSAALVARARLEQHLAAGQSVAADAFARTQVIRLPEAELRASLLASQSIDPKLMAARRADAGERTRP